MTDPARAFPDPAASTMFFEDLFGHDLLDGHKLGVSRFGPSKKAHTFHATPAAAAAWAAEQAEHGDVYFRTTPVLVPPEKGKRGTASIASAIVGVHGDTDIADEVHKKGNLPPDQEAAMRIINAVGIEPTLIVHSGHGLQPHWLLKEPFVFGGLEDHLKATELAEAFQQTLAAAAKATGGWDHDSVGDLARVLRVPGTLNKKREVVPVALLKSGGPRYLIEDIESVLVQSVHADVAPARAGEGSPDVPVGFQGTDDGLLAAARNARNGAAFSALFDKGNLDEYKNDHSHADWHAIDKLAFWTGPDPVRIDRLFRRSKLLRPKWDEVRGGDGKTYGQMTIADVLSKRKEFIRPRSKLPRVIVNVRQLRDETGDAVAALERLNETPSLFQRGSDLVRVRRDITVSRPVIQMASADHVIEMMSRSADFVMPNGDRWVEVRPPLAVARNIMAMPHWNFPPLRGIVSAPRVRADGTVLSTPGYDPQTALILDPIDDLGGLAVPDRPMPEQVHDAVDAIDDVIQDFLFVDLASRANLFAFLLTPFLRPAIDGPVPACVFDALSKQGTGKSLLLRTAMIIATGSEPSMGAIPCSEEEFAKSLTSVLMEGREVVVYDNAIGKVESGVLANAITSPIFDNRILGVSKNAQMPVRCTWAITGNSIQVGGDLARRCYLVMQDAGVEHPEERTDFAHQLPAFAIQNRVRLQQAALTMCRAWWARGCPTPSVRPMGSFEDWTRVVSGVLESAGVPGFLENRQEFRSSAETDRGEWHAFVDALGRVFERGRPFTCGDVVTAADTVDWLKDTLPPRLADAREKRASFATRLGKGLRDHAGAVLGRWRLEGLGPDSHTKKPRYRVISIEPPQRSAGGAVGCGTFSYPPTRENEEIPV